MIRLVMSQEEAIKHITTDCGDIYVREGIGYERQDSHEDVESFDADTEFFPEPYLLVDNLNRNEYIYLMDGTTLVLDDESFAFYDNDLNLAEAMTPHVVAEFSSRVRCASAVLRSHHPDLESDVVLGYSEQGEYLLPVIVGEFSDQSISDQLVEDWNEIAELANFSME